MDDMLGECGWEEGTYWIQFDVLLAADPDPTRCLEKFKIQLEQRGGKPEEASQRLELNSLLRVFSFFLERSSNVF